MTSGLTVLLGAGASREAGLPLSSDLTREIHSLITSSPPIRRNSEVAEALNFVCGTLIKYDSDRGGSPDKFPDIERLVSAVELLGARDTLEVTPFVDSWDPFVERIDRPHIEPFFNNTFRDAIAQSLSPRGGQPDFAELISRVVLATTMTGAGHIYGRLLNELYGSLRQVLTQADAAGFSYLCPLVDVAADPLVTIATLNYDTGFEMAAQSQGMSVSTGIEGWESGSPTPWPPGFLKLLKLHGSINWSWDFRERFLPPAPSVVVSDSPDHDTRSPAIVFGQREKLRAEGPFLELMAEFIRNLEASDLLAVVGYSFHDNHINELIRRWMSRQENRHLIVVDPHFSIVHPSGSFIKPDFARSMQSRYDPTGMNSAHPLGAQPLRFHLIEEPASSGIPTALELIRSWVTPVQGTSVESERVDGGTG
jgi:SIR2-like domain